MYIIVINAWRFPSSLACGHENDHHIKFTFDNFSFWQFISVRYVLAFSCPSFRLMQACIDVAFPYAHIRDAFGKKIGEHQVNNNHLFSINSPFCEWSLH